MGRKALQALTCPNCNGEVELDKEQEYGFCKYCGTKVQNSNFKIVKGKVSIDNSDFVAKCLANARRAKSKEDWEEVERYYNLVEQNDPTNIEAIFYSSFGKAKLSMVEDNVFKREQILNVLSKSISVIDDNYDKKEFKENLKIITKMNEDLLDMYRTNFVYTQTTNGNGSVTNNSNKTFIMFGNLALSFIESMNNIIAVDEHIEYKKIVLEQYNYVITNVHMNNDVKNDCHAKALELLAEIQKEDPDFNATVPNVAVENSGCIAAIIVAIIIFIIIINIC